MHLAVNKDFNWCARDRVGEYMFFRTMPRLSQKYEMWLQGDDEGEWSYDECCAGINLFGVPQSGELALYKRVSSTDWKKVPESQWLLD